jgi:glycosyltransferase involved in cell wall biosynthesis
MGIVGKKSLDSSDKHVLPNESFALGGASESLEYRKIVVDVTAVSGQAFFTGVQRIVREFCDANSRKILLVRWDAKYGFFRVVPQLARLRYRTEKGFFGRLRVWLKTAYKNFSRDYRHNGPKSALVPMWVRFIARKFYDSFLSDVTVEGVSGFHKNPQWHPAPWQTFLLLDIPTSIPHTEGIIELIESHDVRTITYLHDLFPLTHKELFNKGVYPGLRAKHLRYLDAITGSDKVVCNSNYTRSQYERFRAIFDRPFSQEISVVYPPWPKSHDQQKQPAEGMKEMFQFSDIRILAVGAMDKRKNFLVLVQAFDQLVSQGLDARLVLVAGSTGQRDPELMATLSSIQTGTRERIQILPQVSESSLLDLYSAASVVAVPSLAEGFGLPVVEAIAKGKPVVVARSTALTELAAVLPIEVVDPKIASDWAIALARASNSQLSGPILPPKEFPVDWADFTSRLGL